MDTSQQLDAEIEQAFRGVCRPKTMLHADCKDDSEIAVFYPYTRWQDIEDRHVASEISALCFVSAEGFQFLIPAYMRYALRQMAAGSFAVDAAVYALCPSGESASFQRSKYEKLTPAQYLSIRHFLQFMAQHAEAVDARVAAQGLRTVWTDTQSRPASARSAN